MAALPWPTPKVWLVKINSRSARASFFSLSLSFFGFLNCAIFTRFAAFMALLGLPSCWAAEQRGGGRVLSLFRQVSWPLRAIKCQPCERRIPVETRVQVESEGEGEGEVEVQSKLKSLTTSKLRASRALPRLIELQLPLKVPF